MDLLEILFGALELLIELLHASGYRAGDVGRLWRLILSSMCGIGIALYAVSAIESRVIRWLSATASASAGLTAGILWQCRRRR